MTLFKRPFIPRGIRWRVLEAAIGLVALLVCSQLAWLSWINVSQRLETHSHRIWLLPAERDPERDRYVRQKEQSGGTTLNVTDGFFRFQIFGPPGEMLQVWLNNVEQDEVSLNELGRLDGRVNLRRGTNRLEARTRAGYFSQNFWPEDWMYVSYHPPVLLTPHLLGMIPVDDTKATLIGCAEPDSTVSLSRGPDAPGLDFGNANSIGIFSITPFRTASLGESLAIYVTPLSGIAQPSPQNITRFSLGSVAERGLSPLNRQIQIRATGSDFSMQYRLNLSGQVATLQDWARAVDLTAQQAISTLFGICVGPPRGSEAFAASESAGLMETESGCLSAFGISAAKPGTLNISPPRLEITNDGLMVNLNGALPPDGLGVIVDRGNPDYVRLLASPQDSIELITDDKIDVDTVENPSEARPGTSIWRGAQANPTRRVLAELHLKAATPAAQVAVSASPRQAPEPPLGADREEPEVVSLGSISYKVPAPIAGLLRALLAATPFVWLLWILFRLAPRRAGYRRALAACTATFLMFHLTVLSLPFIFLGFGLSSLVAQASGQSKTWVMLLDSVGRVFPFWALGIIFIIRPAYLAFAHSKPPLTAKRRILFHLGRWLVFWPLVLTVPAFLFLQLNKLESVKRNVTNFTGTNPEGWRQILPPETLVTAGVVMAFAFVASCFFLYWVFRVFNRALSAKALLVSCSAFLLLPALPPLLASTLSRLRGEIVMAWHYYPTWMPQQPGSLAWFVIIVWAGAALLMRLSYLTLHQLDYPPSLTWLRPGPRRVALYLVFALASVPLAYFEPAAGYRLGVYQLTQLNAQVDYLLPYALIPGLIMLMRKANPDDSFEIPREAASVGVLLFAFYLAGRSVNFFFIPVPLILGWWVFTHWVLEARGERGSRLASGELKELVARSVRHGEWMGLVRSRRKALEKKYSDGSVNLEDYRKGFAETEQLEKEAESLLPEGAAVSRRKVFAFGPESGPWANGRLAALYGLILSLPFEFAALKTLSTGNDHGDFPLLDGSLQLLFPLSTWVLSAFVFGYFYHRIRGRDGFEKAMVFSAALIIPTIPMRMIGGGQVLNAGHLWQIFEVMAFMLVLALLAFDLRLLSKLKYTWRELLAVYGLTSIVAYGTSLAIAAVGIVVQQQLVSFLTGLFKK